MYDLPGYVWAMVLVGAIGIPAATSVALYRGAMNAGFGRRGAAGVGAAAAVLLGGWVVASGVLARASVYDRRELLSPLVIAAAATLVALLAATRIPVVSRVGLADLVVAVSTATLARILLVTPSTDPLRLLPLALIPTTAVPLAITLHVVSLGRLLPRPAPEPALQA